MFYIPSTIKNFSLFLEQEQLLWQNLWANFPQSVNEFNAIYESSYDRRNEGGEVFVLRNKEAKEAHKFPSAIIMPRRYYEEDGWVPFRPKSGEFSKKDWGTIVMSEGGKLFKRDEYNNDLDPIEIECSRTTKSEYHKIFTDDKWKEGDNILLRTWNLMYPIKFLESVIQKGWNKDSLCTVLLEGEPRVVTWNVEKRITGRDSWTGDFETQTKRTWYTIHMESGVKIEDFPVELNTSKGHLYVSCPGLGINDVLY